MELFKLFGTIAINNKDANKAIDDTTGKAEKSESVMSSAFKKIGKAITTYFAVNKLVAFGKSVVDTTASFEDGMLKVQSLTGATQAEYQKLSDAALNYGSTTAWTAKDVSDAMGYMALAGFNTNEILESTSGMLSLASASGEDLASVTDILTDSMTGFGDSASDANRYADVLATTQAKSNTTVGDLGEAFKYVSSLAGTYKYSLEDVSAALGTMANAGVKGSMAGTALSSIITRLGTNTNGARDAIEALGVQFYNQDGTARNLGDVLKDLCNATEGMDVAQKAELASTVAGAEAQKGLLAILNQGSGAYEDLQSKLYDCSGAASDMATNMESGLGGAIRSMSSAWEGFKINLGEKFEQPLGNAIRNAASWLSETATPRLMDFIDKAVDGFNTFKETIQPAVDKVKDAFDHLKEALSPITDKIEEYISSGNAAEDATTLFNTALDVISSTIEIVAGAIDGLAGFIETIIQGFKDMKQWCSENKTALELLAVAAGTITGLIIAANAGTIALNATMGVANGLLIAGSVAEGIMTAATTVWSGVCSVATAATTALGAAFTFLTSPIAIIIIAIGAAIAVGVLLYKNWDTIKEKLSELWEHIKEVWENIKNKIVETVTNIKESIENGFNAIKEKVQNIFETLKNIVSSIWNAIKSVITTVINAIKSVIMGGMNAISQTVTSVLNAIRSVFFSIWNGIKTVVSSVINGIKSVISGGLNAAKSVVFGVLSSIKEKFVSIFDSVKNVVKNAIDKIKGFFKFQWSLPKLKMPHPKISGKFSLNPPSVPKFSIDWYKKAMDNPYMFSSPTVFGSNPENGNLRAAGESGDEMMYGHSNLMEDIRNAVGEQNNAVVDTLNSWFERLLELFMEWFPEFKGQLVLDTGVLVAQTAPEMDKALGKLQASRNRGR